MSRPLTSALIRALNAMGVFPALPTTWANRPDPTTYPVGRSIRVTDLGHATFVNTGTYWRPPGGSITLAQSAVQVSFTGSASEATLASIVIPGGLLGANGALRVTNASTFTSNANSKGHRVKFNGVQISTYSSTTGTGGGYGILMRNRGAQNSQTTQSLIISASAGINTASAVDTSVDQTLTITGVLNVATDVVTLEGYTVEVIIP